MKKVKHVKYSGGKLQWRLLPLAALEEILRGLMFGAQKYGADNWMVGCKWNLYYDAAMRHLTAWYKGSDRDEESGLSHLAHAGCCILFLLTFSLFKKYKKFDNRTKRDYEKLV